MQALKITAAHRSFIYNAVQTQASENEKLRPSHGSSGTEGCIKSLCVNEKVGATSCILSNYNSDAIKAAYLSIV